MGGKSPGMMSSLIWGKGVENMGYGIGVDPRVERMRKGNLIGYVIYGKSRDNEKIMLWDGMG